MRKFIALLVALSPALAILVAAVFIDGLFPVLTALLIAASIIGLTALWVAAIGWAIDELS
jgi:hypothetical protein